MTQYDMGDEDEFRMTDPCDQSEKGPKFRVIDKRAPDWDEQGFPWFLSLPPRYFHITTPHLYPPLKGHPPNISLSRAAQGESGGDFG
jgi:hypothetical protein